MPLTFPSHLAPVLALKVWRPRWFDGVALGTGAMAPDVAYLASGPSARSFADTHSWPALFWWCLPVALVYALVVRSGADSIVAHLPGDRWFGWRGHGSLGRRPDRWWITISSALVGAVSHLGWDWLTHTDEWLWMVFGVRWSSVTDIAWWTVSDLSSTVVGAVVAVMLAARVGRQGVAANEVAASHVRQPCLFWGVAATVAIAGLAVVPLLPGAAFLAVTVVRVLHVLALALLVGGLAVRFCRRRAGPLRRRHDTPTRPGSS
ncbi:protein of unknown function [Micromonospora phaseoli]|uniref:DUF4184 family protein n=1 Tax=Micromonospora phaseoli TaxID=1144548 RepID=A0A1H6V0B7_9ACTN|nr:DUF4184 family protein [Micromonospora phaseoli]PZV93828.1 uncharacterized protein DUF4184 [Micromonospora phaseoli]GIJ80728.1 hypothetical protein Xph01_51600 [Micromonospora phaseoli]SEI96374.1 protein of unknown function [Micromonospora phaseoli]